MATVARHDVNGEVFSALARIHRADALDAGDATVLLSRLGELALTRLPITTLPLHLA